jgi:hypothetical protein
VIEAVIEKKGIGRTEDQGAVIEVRGGIEIGGLGIERIRYLHIYAYI